MFLFLRQARVSLLLLTVIIVLVSCKKETFRQNISVTDQSNVSIGVKEWFGKIKAAGESSLGNHGSVQIGTNSTGTTSIKEKYVASVLENLDLLEANLDYEHALLTEQDKKYNLIVISINDALRDKKSFLLIYH